MFKNIIKKCPWKAHFEMGNAVLKIIRRKYLFKKKERRIHIFIKQIMELLLYTD